MDGCGLGWLCEGDLIRLTIILLSKRPRRTKVFSQLA